MRRTVVSDMGDMLRTVSERIMDDEFYQILFGQIVVWGFLDPVSTFAAMAAYGSAQKELNPVMNQLLQIHPNLILVVKLFALIAVVIIAIEGREYIQSFRYWRTWMHVLLWVGVFVSMKNFLAAFLAL